MSKKTQYKQVVNRVMKSVPGANENHLLKSLAEAINDITEGEDIGKTLSNVNSVLRKSLKPQEAEMIDKVMYGLTMDNEKLKEEKLRMYNKVEHYQIKYLEAKNELTKKDKIIEEKDKIIKDLLEKLGAKDGGFVCQQY